MCLTLYKYVSVLVSQHMWLSICLSESILFVPSLIAADGSQLMFSSKGTHLLIALAVSPL